VTEWLGAVVALAGALGAMGAAWIAARSANRSKAAELQAQRILESEKRLSASRQEVYQPMLEFLRSVLDSATSEKETALDMAQARETLSRFWMWVQVYGSDDMVRAAHKFAQALYTSPPPPIMVRYLNEFVLAVRKDLGEPETRIGLIELAGLRITDIYEPEYQEALTMPEEELWGRENWTAPWAK
jgi:hypothetical protein